MFYNELHYKTINVTRLTYDEKAKYPDYKYKSVGIHELWWGDKYLKIEPGYLTNGSTSSPDGFGNWTFSWWLYHDYLYDTHKWTNGKPCNRHDADLLMYEMIKMNNMNISSSIFWMCTKFFSFKFEEAWESGSKIGPIYI